MGWQCGSSTSDRGPPYPSPTIQPSDGHRSGASECSAGFPPLGPSAGSALLSPGSSEASSPASAVRRRCATPWVPGTTLRCLRVALPGGVSVVSLPAVQSTKPRAGASSAGSPRRQPTPGDHQGLPSSWRILLCLCPVLRPRQDRPTRPPFSGVGAAPVMSTTTAPATHHLSGLHHTALALAVYASSWPLLDTTQDSLPAAGPLYGTGLVTRRILSKGFRPKSSSSPKLAWRKDSLNSGSPSPPGLKSFRTPVNESQLHFGNREINPRIPACQK